MGTKITVLLSILLLTAATFPLCAQTTMESKGPVRESVPELLGKIMAVKFPELDQSKANDPAYVQKYVAEYHAALNRRKELATEFVEAYPDEPAAPNLMLFLAQVAQDDPQKQLAIYRKIAAKYPDTQAAKAAAGPIRQAEGIGKPFELAFTDAIGGKKIDMADMKGKVVVVDFWATWCGPCVGEMPANKEIYEKYHGKDVEFIGVSLDQPESQGGLTSLKDFVASNQIPWPQYYQGNGWMSAFSSSWGINSIPTVFIIDKNGNLYSTSARGQLDTLIPQLLAQRAK